MIPCGPQMNNYCHRTLVHGHCSHFVDACALKHYNLRVHPKCICSKAQINRQQRSTSSLVGNTSVCQASTASQVQATAGTRDQWKVEFMDAAKAAESQQLIELSFKGKITDRLPWRNVVVRPVELRGDLHLQFSYYNERQNIVKNAPYNSAEADQRLQELLYTLPFNSISMKHLEQDVSVQITKSGKAIVHKSRPAAARQPAMLKHDRQKGLPIPPEVAHPFLQAIGMQSADGKLKADMVDKMAQVNEFLKLLGHTGIIELLQKATAQEAEESNGISRRVRILDCGCGSSHLTFGTWHYLNNVLGIPAQLIGVDSNTALMSKSNAYCRDLGLTEEDAMFIATSISDYQPEQPPDVVLALHACDTATDDALALGVQLGASVIMAVPCCHKNLHRQLAAGRGMAITPLQPLMRQGITKQRTLDLVTDTFRAQLLRLAGYKTDVVEFVSTEHTPRNILIRAVKLHQNAQENVQPLETAPAAAQDARSTSRQSSVADGLIQMPENMTGKAAEAARQGLADEYVAMRTFWGNVTPHLETLLRPQLAGILD